MSRHVVVLFAEGYSNDLDDKKNGARYMIFAAELGGRAIFQGAIYIRGAIHKTLQ